MVISRHLCLELHSISSRILSTICILERTGSEMRLPPPGLRTNYRERMMETDTGIAARFTYASFHGREEGPLAHAKCEVRLVAVVLRRFADGGCQSSSCIATSTT